MKKCNWCKELKSLDDFHNQNKSKDGKQNRCKECNRKQRNEYYKTAAGRKSGSVSGLRSQVKNRKLAYDYLKNHSCVDCGESDICVLEFDHRDRELKKFNISASFHLGWKTLLAEIEKCDVRCANCHRRRTAKQFGWRKLLWIEEDNGPLA